MNQSFSLHHSQSIKCVWKYVILKLFFQVLIFYIGRIILSFNIKHTFLDCLLIYYILSPNVCLFLSIHSYLGFALECWFKYHKWKSLVSILVYHFKLHQLSIYYKTEDLNQHLTFYWLSKSLPHRCSNSHIFPHYYYFFNLNYYLGTQ